jgi:hypothetical protein
MSWIGTWKNQFGSIVEITSEAEGRIEGSFRTALKDSAFYGQTVPVFGAHRGNCISFASAGTGPAGDVVVSYTGLLRDGRMETLWFVAADRSISATRQGAPAKAAELNWWRAMTVNADTFERIG